MTEAQQERLAAAESDVQPSGEAAPRIDGFPALDEQIETLRMVAPSAA